MKLLAAGTLVASAIGLAGVIGARSEGRLYDARATAACLRRLPSATVGFFVPSSSIDRNWPGHPSAVTIWFAGFAAARSSTGVPLSARATLHFWPRLAGAFTQYQELSAYYGRFYPDLAVLNVQRHRNVVIDGVAGPMVPAALARMNACLRT